MKNDENKDPQKTVLTEIIVSELRGDGKQTMDAWSGCSALVELGVKKQPRQDNKHRIPLSKLIP